jgi:hypothetical protein
LWCFHKIPNTKACTWSICKMNVNHLRFFCLTNICLISTWPDSLDSLKVIKDSYGLIQILFVLTQYGISNALSVVYKLRIHIPFWMFFSFFWYPLFRTHTSQCKYLHINICYLSLSTSSVLLGCALRDRRNGWFHICFSVNRT